MKDFCEKGLMEIFSFKERESPTNPPIVTG
jgi:hypothetical protein